MKIEESKPLWCYQLVEFHTFDHSDWAMRPIWVGWPLCGPLCVCVFEVMVVFKTHYSWNQWRKTRLKCRWMEWVQRWLHMLQNAWNNIDMTRFRCLKIILILLKWGKIFEMNSLLRYKKLFSPFPGKKSQDKSGHPHNFHTSWWLFLEK